LKQGLMYLEEFGIFFESGLRIVQRVKMIA
jgi:hypothetical protein